MTAAKYVRTALEGDALVAEQLDQLARLADKLGVEGAKTYVDNGVSADVLDENRPALAHLVVDIGAGEIDRVLVVDAARITRDPAAWIRFAEYCRSRGCDIELAQHYTLSR